VKHNIYILLHACPQCDYSILGRIYSSRRNKLILTAEFCINFVRRPWNKEKIKLLPYLFKLLLYLLVNPTVKISLLNFVNFMEQWFHFSRGTRGFEGAYVPAASREPFSDWPLFGWHFFRGNPFFLRGNLFHHRAEGPSVWGETSSRGTRGPEGPTVRSDPRSGGTRRPDGPQFRDNATHWS